MKTKNAPVTYVLSVYQYSDPSKVPPGVDRGDCDDDTRWIAAPSLHLADAYADTQGWDECGGLVWTPEQIVGIGHDQSADSLFKMGMDVVLRPDNDGNMQALLPYDGEGEAYSRPATLLEELQIEGGLVPNRRGQLYRLAKERIEKAEALLRYYDIDKVVAYLNSVDKV